MRVHTQIASLLLIFFSFTSIAKSRNAARELPVNSGTRRVLALPIQFVDTPLTCSTEDLKSTLFTAPNSVAALYAEMSYGGTSLDGEVLAPLVVNAENGTCEWELWSQMALEAAAASGVDVTSYQHRIFLFPAGLCNPTAFSELGQTNIYNFGLCGEVFSHAHEIGHNIGFNHASTPIQETGDLSSLMGAPEKPVHLNTVEKEKAGWIPGDKIAEFTLSGDYVLSSSQRLVGSDPILGKIEDAVDGPYYISFRTPEGFDANLPEGWQNRVYVHQWVNGISVLHALLNAGESFTSPSGQTAIQMISQNGDTATVSVRIGAVLEEPMAPSLNLFPSSQSGLAGSTLSYELQVTNNDPTSLGSTTFDVTAVLPEGLTAEFPANLTLAAGTSLTLPILVTSHPTSAANILEFSITLNDTAAPIHNASISASYQVETLQALPPIVTFTPNSQSGKAGSTLTYVLTISNQDPTGLPPSTFDVTFQGTGLTASFEPNYTLETGALATVEIQVTSAANAPSGPLPFVVRISDEKESVHTVLIDGLYTVEAAATDLTAPTSPTQLTAQGLCGPRKVVLTWRASKDNVGVAGYQVWRNGTKFVVTKTTNLHDLLVSGKKTYSYKVQAFDAIGNLSGFSNEVRIKFLRDGDEGC